MVLLEPCMTDTDLAAKLPWQMGWVHACHAVSRRGIVAPRTAVRANLSDYSDSRATIFASCVSNAEARWLIEGEQLGERLIDESVSV